MKEHEKNRTDFPFGQTEGVFVDTDGKPSDMSPDSVMSMDGCNPVSRDSERERAYDRDDPLLFPDAFPGAIPPAWFPGAGFFPGNMM